MTPQTAKCKFDITTRHKGTSKSTFMTTTVAHLDLALLEFDRHRGDNMA